MLTIDRANATNGKARAYQLNEPLESMYNRNGVIAGLTPTRSSDDVVAYAAGAIVADSVYVDKGASTLTLAARDATNPRYSFVVINSSGTVSEVAGTAAAVPTPPTLPTDKVSIATCYVPATGGGALVVEDGRVMLPHDNNKSWILLKDSVSFSGAATATLVTGLSAGDWRAFKIHYTTSAGSNGTLGLRLNNDTTASDYFALSISGTTYGTTTAAYYFCSQIGTDTSAQATGIYEISSDTIGTDQYNIFKGFSVGKQSATNTAAFGGYKITPVGITSIQLFCDTSNLAGTARVWGQLA